MHYSILNYFLTPTLILLSFNLIKRHEDRYNIFFQKTFINLNNLSASEILPLNKIIYRKFLFHKTKKDEIRFI
jgi:hypothetical protein